ncbi:hypothetical protein F511_16395 [Dorcoceras hygrometricum]|uniref:Uncharacterized protein n=1 Tax=Dorcoceras hygrometricum TaxID=472368 RepID=A0A2Z7BK91_9LAMI|nr:hypothetical protein F511_16395 [Dorcoceras hygrometricum]
MVVIHSSQHAVPEARTEQLNPVVAQAHESVVAIHSSHSGNNQNSREERSTVASRSSSNDAITAIRRDPLALPSGPITRGRSKKFKEALHELVLSTQEMFKEEGNPTHEKLVGGLRDYIVKIIQVQD